MARSNSNQGANKTADAQQSDGLQANEAGAVASGAVGQVDTLQTGAQPGPDSPTTSGTSTDAASDVESQASATAGDQQGVTVLGSESQTDGSSDSGESDVAAVVAVGDDEGNLITIYPLRSYLDGKEIRRAGGEGYKSAKHDAVSLIAAGLATDQKPKS
ncbi:hypothetical protein [Pseudomonas syringae group sp. J309-1]|uniref:hypothetical protein n=1 Tax=Pseudomonas syringae group sp. J309-1 TaxID=3079588 RepID=UPI002913C01E|nr:hypothetical protein [Pseudomonas syringae group sp. J309-1]MDU8357987.1 hypothetical protein [Pseudomonas syringae group sp. J309-1]